MMKQREDGRRADDGKRGVAIVLILGLLGLLTLAAVAFSVSMRVERRAAGHFRHGIQARHMLRIALAEAIADINWDLDNTDGFLVYPDWDFIVSGEEDGDAAHVMTAGAMEFIPGDPDIPNSLADRVASCTSRWDMLEAAGRTRGRYAYVAVNCSGLLDANKVGKLGRANGADGREIQVEDDCPNEVFDAEAFTNASLSHRRYEVLPEVRTNWGLYADACPENFAVYSLAPVGQRFDLARDRLYPTVWVGGDTNELVENEDEIKTAFMACGVNDPGLAFSNLIDYVDEDSIPWNLASACTEAVPMINEVWLYQYDIEVQPNGVFTSQLFLAIECAYPFATPSTEDYIVDYHIKFEDRGSSVPGVVPVGPITATNPPTLGRGIVAGSYLPVVIDPMPIRYTGTIPTNKAAVVHFGIYVSAVVTDALGNHVDEVPSPYDPDNTTTGVELEVSLPAVWAGNTYTAESDWTECVDPRFNWDPDPAGANDLGPQWYRASVVRPIIPNAQATVGTGDDTNNFTKFFFFPWTLGQSDLWDLDDDTLMYVANRPLRTTGELGHLCYAPWRTIRLYDHRWSNPPSPYPEGAEEKRYHQIFDYFTVRQSPYVRGLVNVNTRQVDVLAAAFNQAPRNEYAVSTDPLDWSDALFIASNIVTDTSSNGFYMGVSELGNSNGVEWTELGSTEIARESLIRNTADLLTVRQNLFTIILRAESYSPGMAGEGGMTLASGRAVAEVWRDPFPACDADGVLLRDVSSNRLHRCLVRLLKYVDE